MRLEKVMSLFLKAKCGPIALMVKKQCSAVRSKVLHWGQVYENKRKYRITALIALDSAVTPHFINQNNGFPSYACGRAFYLKIKGATPPALRGGGLRSGWSK